MGLPLRLLHVSQPVEAGVPEVVASLVAYQRARGHQVHVACPSGPGLARRVTAVAGAHHHPWPATRSPGLSVPDEVARLRQIIDHVDPDLVVLHSAKAGLAGRLAVRGRRPTVFAPHAWSFEAVRGLVGAASTAWEVFAGRWADLVVCVSEDERDRGRSLGMTCDMRVVPNGVDVESRAPRPGGLARATLGLPERPTVVCVGRLAEQKGQDLLLAAWPQVQAEVPDAHLVLVGDGPRRAALEATAPDGVTFTGAREDVDDFLAAADVVALPSRWESTPLVSLESMAMGRPVVAFEVDGVRAALGDTGRVLPPGDVPGLASALAELLRSPEAARAAGRAARERAVAVADRRRTLQAWDELLTSLVRDRRMHARPLHVAPVTSITRSVFAGALATVDVAEVDGEARGAALRAAVLSALGLPVWWHASSRRPPASFGAPIVSGAIDQEELARAARRPGAGRLGGPSVSVVVTVLNEGAELRRLVEALLDQLRDDDELVITDGGSSDGSLASLPPHPALRIEVVPGAGISAGRNHGVRAARNDVLICTDAGCTPQPGFVDACRRAFAVADPPALVSGVYTLSQRTALDRAQALACYPQPHEARRPHVLVRAYTRFFGSGYDPRFAVGRCVAFSRGAWAAVGGFPEHLATGEDVSFGLAVARHGACVGSTDVLVEWTQREGIAATWRMYRGYGRASTGGGDRALLVRDGVRGTAYLLAPLLSSRPAGRRLVGAAAAAYLSVPVLRTLRAGAGISTLALLPVALVTKDLGKLAGALEGVGRSMGEAR